MQAKGLTPILNVSNLEKSFAWFEALGWEKGWDWGRVREMHVRHPDGHVFRVSRGLTEEE